MRIQLERVYGGRDIDERPGQILARHRKLREVGCSGITDIPDFIVMLDGMRERYDLPDDPRSDYVKRTAIILWVRDTIPHLINQLISRPAVGGRSEESMVLQIRAGENAQGESKLGADQCASCVMKKHRWRECRRHLSGKPPTWRRNGMPPARNFIPPPTSDKRREQSDGKAFFSFNIAVGKDGGRSGAAEPPAC